MNKYKLMTCTLVVCNVISLVAMFIAAFWGFTYPTIEVDGYESGKSAIVATFIWMRIPNYPVLGNVTTQVYVMAVPKLILVVFSFALSCKLRQDDIQRRLSRSDPRCRCDSNSRHTASRQSMRSFHNMPIEGPAGGLPGLPPPLPPPNAIIRTPPLYPMHRPSLSSPLPPQLPPVCRTPPLHGPPINGPMTGPPGTPPWRTERKWSATTDRVVSHSPHPRDYDRHYYRDVYNPNY
ncbi:uncharacterized protein LOC128961176 [Oppia nitens]|uniref:uncharacterized protein LOC128961176 n=1 Tax=Oppia nitens TaxID=1686743 RepID=UPI0023DBAFA7|nr:uncharacterized protein LOC128961176 [Oppia nitens]